MGCTTAEKMMLISFNKKDLTQQQIESNLASDGRYLCFCCSLPNISVGTICINLH